MTYTVEPNVFDAYALSGESLEFLALSTWAQARGICVCRITVDSDLERLLHERTTLVMLDAAPDPLGTLAQCARVSALWPKLPILVLGPEEPEQQRFREAALPFGATVLDRPVGESRLLAALEACVRGRPRPTGTGFISLGDGYMLDLQGRCLRIGNMERALTKGKFELLAYLIGHAGRAVSAEELVRCGVLARSQRSRYRAIVQELRSKLGGARAVIRTVQGYGYRFDPPNARDDRGRRPALCRAPERAG